MFKKALLISLGLAACMSASAAKLSAESSAMRAPAPATPGQHAYVLVLENRREVMEDGKKENYEGVTRELYGIPIARATADKTPMNQYLGERLRIGFQNAGWQSSYQPSAKGTRADALVQPLEMQKDGLALVVDMRDWNYDFGGFSPEFAYDVTLSVYDQQKTLLARREFKGIDPMPTGGWKHFKKRYAELYQTLFERFFADPDIAAALRGTPTLASVAAGTVEDRLRKLHSLLDQGLIDQVTFDREQQRISAEL